MIHDELCRFERTENVYLTGDTSASFSWTSMSSRITTKRPPSPVELHSVRTLFLCSCGSNDFLVSPSEGPNCCASTSFVMSIIADASEIQGTGRDNFPESTPVITNHIGKKEVAAEHRVTPNLRKEETIFCHTEHVPRWGGASPRSPETSL